MNIIEEPFPEEGLKALVDLASEHAETVLVKAHESLMPTWLLTDGKGCLYLVGTPWRDEKEKYNAHLAMRDFVREREIVAYGFVVEAWLATRPPGWRPEPGKPAPRPAEDPNRREVVMAVATNGKTQRFRTWATRRDAAGKVSALVEEEADDYAKNLFGWMCELFAEPQRR